MEDNTILQQIGKRLVSTRMACGITQEQLAAAIGLSWKTISAAENGQKALRPENIIKICDCLSISTDYLLKGVTEELNSIAGKRIADLTAKQRTALSNIVDEFLSAFEN